MSSPSIRDAARHNEIWRNRAKHGEEVSGLIRTCNEFAKAGLGISDDSPDLGISSGFQKMSDFYL
jgi:hypothetical protein